MKGKKLNVCGLVEFSYRLKTFADPTQEILRKCDLRKKSCVEVQGVEKI